jgi:hypothetical protein
VKKRGNKGRTLPQKCLYRSITFSHSSIVITLALTCCANNRRRFLTSSCDNDNVDDNDDDGGDDGDDDDGILSLRLISVQVLVSQMLTFVTNLATSFATSSWSPYVDDDVAVVALVVTGDVDVEGDDVGEVVGGVGVGKRVVNKASSVIFGDIAVNKVCQPSTPNAPVHTFHIHSTHHMQHPCP